MKSARRAVAGLALPGLGHLLHGEWVVGLGLMVLVGVEGFAAVSGVQRGLWTVLYPDATGIAWHGLLSLLAWVVIAGALWWTAWRRAFPPVLTVAERRTNRALFLAAMRVHRTGMLGFFGVLFLLSITLLTPLIAPFGPDLVYVGPALSPPDQIHRLGTDGFGRDVFSRLLYGGRISLSIGFVAVSIAATLGTSVGAAAGFFGGWVDRSLMWVTDLLLSLPRLVLLITIAGLFPMSGAGAIFLMVTVLGLTGWMGVARIVRSEVLSLKERDFVAAARAIGMSDMRILWRHIVPNALAPVIVFCSLAIGSTMLAEAALSFLGLGVQPPTATWGVMVDNGREPLRDAPWVAIFPGLAIVAAVMAFNLVGDGLRDALDPKLKRVGR